MQTATVTLSDRITMLHALNYFGGIGGILSSRQRFYETLLAHAGETGTVDGVVSMLIVAIEGHTLGMPSINAELLYMKAPKFIDALLHENWVVADEAKAIFADRLH